MAKWRQYSQVLASPAGAVLRRFSIYIQPPRTENPNSKASTELEVGVQVGGGSLRRERGRLNGGGTGHVWPHATVVPQVFHLRRPDEDAETSPKKRRRWPRAPRPAHFGAGALLRSVE